MWAPCGVMSYSFLIENHWKYSLWEFLPSEIKQQHQRKEERCVTTQKTAAEQTTGKSQSYNAVWTSHFITPYPTCAIIFARHQTRQTGNLRYQLGEAHKCYYSVEEQWLKREKILYAWCTHRSECSVTSDPGSWPESISRKWHRNLFQNQNE